MRRASAGDLPQVSSNQHNHLEKLRFEHVSDQKQSTGCFGCLSKRNTPKREVQDGVLNNTKHKEKVGVDCVSGLSDTPRDGSNFSGSKNFHSNIINNLNNLGMNISLDRETPILNNMTTVTAMSKRPQVRSEDLQSHDSTLPEKVTLAEGVAVHRSDSIEKCLPHQLDSSLKHGNLSKGDDTERLTTDSGIDLISSPPYPQTSENIYDSVRHFNSRRLKSQSEVSSRKLEDLENVEFHHKIGRDLIMEIDSENFDAIHFEGYRTAQKLNYIRQKLKLHHVDINQVMDAFNESSIQKLMDINDLYQLSGRLYSSQQQQLHGNMSSALNTESQSKTSTLLVGWLLHVFDLKKVGCVGSFSVKVALSSVCVGPLFEKLKYIFKDMHAEDGALTKESLQTYLCSVLSLPSSLATRHSLRSNFMLSMECSIDKFLEEMVRGEVPSCLGWLQILHNLIRAEQVVHAVECASCSVTNFSGFLYKCLECPNYLMCQSCFWRGFTSEGHTVQHKVKELITPDKISSDEPERLHGATLDLRHNKGGSCRQGKIISDLPGSPLSSLNGFFQPWSSANITPSGGIKISMISIEESLSAGRMRRVIPQTSEDDEHKLISRYVHRLKCCPLKTEPLDPVSERQNLVFELEAKNREIQKEIQRLKYHQMQQRDRRSAALVSESELSDDQLDQNLLKEIRFLRQHQGDLEARIKGLQGSRRGLMQQLEGLMRKLKTQSSLSPSVCSPQSYCDSPAFTFPSSLPYTDTTAHHSLPLHQPHHPIPPLSSHTLQTQTSFQSQSAQQTFHQLLPPSSFASPSPRFPHQPFQTAKIHLLPQSSPKSPGLNPVNYSMGSEFHQAFAFPSPSNVQGLQNVGLRQDLLMATDKVTDAMSSLVLELNTEESSDSEQERTRNFAAALKSPRKKHVESDFDDMHIRSTFMIPRSVGSSEEAGDLKRVGSLRENEVHWTGGIQEKESTVRDGTMSESEPNMDSDPKFHSRSVEIDENEFRQKWEGPKRRWSNR